MAEVFRRVQSYKGLGAPVSSDGDHTSFPLPSPWWILPRWGTVQLFGGLREWRNGLLSLRSDRNRRVVSIGMLWLIWIIGLAGTTALCSIFGLSATSASYAYLMAIVLLSLLESFVTSAVFALGAVACINFFFLEPRFSFQVLQREDLIMLGAFIVTALVVTTLVRKARDLGAINREKTEILALTERLQQAQAELAHVTRITMLGEITASVAREVNQPLAAIVTNGEAGLRFISRDPAELGEVRGCLDRMVAEGRRASEVVQRIRALTKKSDVQATSVDLNTIVRESVALLQREATNHGVTMRLELAPVMPTVKADKVQLQQVLMNLVINGLQAMPAVQDRAHDLLIQTYVEPTCVRVAVRDNGVGLEPDQAKRLFSPFFTTKPNGMGIGLSLCRTIVEAHGGRIWVSRSPGPGTTFEFSLPAGITRESD
jgi:C4-dicarboxylate-specific signal transduction histidine kinase